MRYITTVCAASIVVAILACSCCLYVAGEENREERQQAYDDYDIQGYYDELEKRGIHTWNPGRLWPGSIDPSVVVHVHDLGLLISSAIGNYSYTASD